MSVPDTTEDFWAAKEYFSRSVRFRERPLHKANQGLPLCGAEVDPEKLRERVRAKWSVVTCKACLALMPDEVRLAIKVREDEDRIRTEAERAFADQVDLIHRETRLSRWRCEAALRKIGNPERTMAWLKGIVQREKEAHR